MFGFLKRTTPVPVPAPAKAENEYEWLTPHIVHRLRAGAERAKEVKRKAAYSRGYDFAAGALLRGEETVQSLEARVCSHFPQSEEANAFDLGIRDAISRLVRAGTVEDSSIF